MSVTIRKLELEDISALLTLMREFARFERLEEHLEVTEERLTAAMFSGNAFVHGLMAFQHELAVGYAIFYPNFSTFRGQRGFFLEDLYISDHARGTGIGKAMLSRVAGIAVEQGFERIDFLVLDWNEAAIGFYEQLGAEKADGETHFKFTDDAFRALTSRPPDFQ